VQTSLPSLSIHNTAAFSLNCRRPTFSGSRYACLLPKIAVLANRFFVFTLHFVLSFPLAQQFSLNCCCATPCRSNYACLLRKIGLFCLFAAVVKSARLVARLAALRHKTTFSATKSAHLSRVVAVVRHSASAAAAATTKSQPISRFAFVFMLHYLLYLLITYHSLLLWLYFPLSTLHFALSFPPGLWRDWQLYATKRPFPPQNRHIFPVWSPLSAILPVLPPPPQQKANPSPDFICAFFCFYSSLVTHYCLLLLLGTINLELFY
jgi:hypothetical protein